MEVPYVDQKSASCPVFPIEILRGFEANPPFLKHIIVFQDRLFTIPAKLDSTSLHAKRKLSIPFVKGVMHAHNEEQEKQYQNPLLSSV